MSTIAERLLLLRGKTKQGDFAKQLGINPNTLRSYENGRSFPNQEFLEQICVQFSVYAEWILLGRGPMRIGDPVETLQAAPIESAIAICPRCAKLEEKLEKLELQRDELVQENRQLWKENAELRERCATLEERQKQCCPDQYHPKKANIPSSDPLHVR